MKPFAIIISTLTITSLQLVAQKSTHQHNNLLDLHRANENTIEGTKRIVNHEITNVPVINCWIKPMGTTINSEYPEYTPVLNANSNTMVFTSRRENNTGNKKTIDGNYKAEDIYITTKNNNGEWNQAAKLTANINTNKNEAVTWISKNGDDMILCKEEDLYESYLVNGVWSKPTPISMINSTYRETHASYSPDGNTIYFTTDNPEIATIGGLDICKIEKDPSGEWKKPVLVENINSPLNEDDPTLMADGKTLYFSSQGFESLGGYDMFKTTLNNEMEFSQPQNLGFPLNTEANEPFMSITADGKKAYLSSDRGEDGEQNIYEIIFQDKIKVSLLVEVYDIDTKQLINSNVTVTNVKNKTNVYMDNATTGVFGNTDIELNTFYHFTASAKGYSTADTNLNTIPIQEFNPDTFRYVQKIYLKADKKEMDINFDKTVHFEYGKFDMIPSSILIVNKIKEVLSNNPGLTIIINAHTDNVGSENFNYTLSNKRGNAVLQWFVNNGIDANRITVKGFGEDKPMVKNDTDADRAKNRRAEIEFIIK